MKNFKKIYSLILILTFILAVLPVNASEQSPFKPLAIPGLINACDFDLGGENVAYSPLGSARVGMYNYRDDAELNFYNNSLGVVMGFYENNWLKYTVTVPKDGLYEATGLYAVPNDGSELEITFDDNTLIKAALAGTGGWNTLGETTVGRVRLTKGKHIMKLCMKIGATTFKGVRFEEVFENSVDIDFSKKSGPYRNVYIPAVIEAEDYDIGTDASKSIDGSNSGKAYRKNDVMDIYDIAGTGYFLRLNQKEYVKYTYNVDYDAPYTLFVKSMSSGKLNIYFDDCINPITVNTVSGSEVQAVSIYLKKGIHVLKLIAESSFVDIDNLRFSNAVSDYIKPESLNEQEEQEDLSNDYEKEKVYCQFFVDELGSDDNDGSEEKPFKTIKGAKNAVKKISDNMDGDIIVNINPGYYKIDNTEIFDDTDSGKNGFDIIYRGFNRLSPPIISGGDKITGWQKQDNKIWKAKADVEDTRTLYVNGLSAQRARSKYKYEGKEAYKAPDSEYKDDGVNVSLINFPKLTNTNELELVWDLYWTCQRTPVKEILYNSDMASIIMDQPYYNWARTKSYDGTNPKPDSSFYIENALELLDEPGEFYFDKSKKEIYYYPFNEEDMTTAQTYVGTTEYLFSLCGKNSEKKVQNIKFDNLDFRYGAWNGLSTTGLSVIQADKAINGENNAVARGGRMIPAQFTLTYSKNIDIENCSFSCLGSGAIAMDNGVLDCNVSGNLFHDISGTAVIVGSWDHNDFMTEGMERCRNITISDNVIRRVACELRGSCGITLYYVNRVSVIHNDIKDIPYSGVSMGWGWGEDVKESSDNLIAYNRIENVTNPTHDGAHIYMLGPLRNTVIKGNYLINSGDSRGGVYTDQGTAYVNISDNVMEKCPVWLFGIKNVGLKLINASGNFTDSKNGGPEDTTNINVTDTTVVTDGNWPEKAVDIINNSGVSGGYKRLLFDVDRPKWRTNFITDIPKSLYKSKTSPWIEAEDFNKGGQDVGYFKFEQQNPNKVYRDEGVSFYAQGDNYVIGNTKPGEWLKYDFTQEKSGEYYLILKAANGFALTDIQPKVNIYIDDILVADKAEIPNNNSWKIHSPVNIGKFNINAGRHVLKVEFSDNGFSFDAWKLDENEKEVNDPQYDEGVLTEQKEYFDGFYDMEKHWAKDTVRNLYDKGVIKGIDKNIFSPDTNLTLYQASLLILRSFDIDYTDDDFISVAKSCNIIKDSDENSYVTREHFIDMIMKCYMAKYKEYDVTYKDDIFNDMSDVDDEYKLSVMGAKTAGYIIGDLNGNFNPKAFLTRAEAACVVERIISK